MFGFGAAQPQPIGLDIGQDSIKLLQVSTSGTSLKVRAAARFQIRRRAPATGDFQILPDETLEAIAHLIHAGHFKGRTVVASLPRQFVHAKNLRLAPVAPEELPAIVKSESRQLFDFDTDEAHIDFLPAGEVRQGGDIRQEIIALAVRKPDIDHYLERLNSAGVVVESLDIEPCALYRSVERFVRRREDEAEVFAIIDIGSQATQVIIGKGRNISFIKPIEIGGNRLNEAVSAKLGISFDEARDLRRRLGEDEQAPDARREQVRQAIYDATRSTTEELTREIALCLRYHSVTFRGHRPTKLRLTGGEASDGQLRAILRGALPIPVETARPLFSVDTSAMRLSERRGACAEWALALGLSLKRTTDYFSPLDGASRATQNLRGEDSNPLIAEGSAEEKRRDGETHRDEKHRDGKMNTTPESSHAINQTPAALANRLSKVEAALA